MTWLQWAQIAFLCVVLVVMVDRALQRWHARPWKPFPEPATVAAIDPWRLVVDSKDAAIAHLEAEIVRAESRRVEEQERWERLLKAADARNDRLREEFYHLVDARFNASLEWNRGVAEREMPPVAEPDPKKRPARRAESSPGVRANLYAGGHIDPEDEEPERFHPEDEEEPDPDEEADAHVQEMLLAREREKAAAVPGQG